jgi:UDP-glucose 4-epimerase
MEKKTGKFLITGGAGFIGSHLAAKLAQRGHSVAVADNLSTGRLDNLNVNVDFHQIDSDETGLLKEKYDWIFHLGIPSTTRLYRDNPFLTADALNGMISVLEVAKETGAKVVYASSSSVYNGQSLALCEGVPLYVKDFYTEARIAIERMAELYYDFYKVKSIGLRFFSVYGDNEDSKGDFANLVSQFIWAVRDGKKPVIYGDGEQTRDFVFVDDICEGLILAMESDIENDIFNLGTGRECSLNELVKKIGFHFGKNVEAEYVKNPLKNYVQNTCADTRKTRMELSWNPQTDLDEGIKKIIKQWQHKKN